jgi:hypothetical protein
MQTSSSNAHQAADSDLGEILTAARSQLPSGLEPTNVQTYLDGIAAYIYGYPLVCIALTERVSTSVEFANQQLGRAPLNQLYRAMALPVGSQFKDVVLPSTTTMYATGFFNLQKEPLILRIPAIASDRFFIVQLLDAWTNVSRHSPGSRLGSSTPGDYALVGPCWTGDLPDGLAEVIHFDTNTVWQIMRVLTNGTTDDQNTVYTQIFKPLIPLPLSAYGTDYTPPDNLTINPSIDTTTQPIKQADSMDACAFFGTMSAMMKTNPPRKIDVALVPILERLGVWSAVDGGPVQFSCANFTTEQQSQEIALQLAVIKARQILAQPPQQALTSTNWSVSLEVGDYGVRYLLRAIVAKNALGANRPQDAVYGTAFTTAPVGIRTITSMVPTTTCCISRRPPRRRRPWRFPPSTATASGPSPCTTSMERWLTTKLRRTMRLPPTDPSREKWKGISPARTPTARSMSTSSPRRPPTRSSCATGWSRPSRRPPITMASSSCSCACTGPTRPS